MLQIQNLRSIAKTRWLNVWELLYRHKDKDASWVFASRQADPRKILDELSTGQKNADAVAIVPIIFNRNAWFFSLLVTKEFRPITGGYEYGFPAGLVDAGETLEEAAGRELLEETGYEITHILAESPATYSSAGLSDECVSTFVVLVQKLGDQQLEKNEDIEVISVPLEDLEDLCKLQGKFSGGSMSARAWPIFFALQMAKQYFPLRLLKDAVLARIGELE